MNLYLYVNSSENNRVDKALSSELQMTGHLRTETSVVSPVLMIEGENLTGYNYAYIPEFNRFYYITDITSVRTGLWQVSMRVDVLMTYSVEIKQLTAVLERQENIYNLYCEDNMLTTLAYDNVYTQKMKFEGGAVMPIDDWHYYLAVAGGVS